ncbi:metallophosphoesterase family protein [Stratiformator vulcanicus]|uniref:PhoD-like phosphatase n=1 Tax=Stratiformator vulcanicus TaxID=2527980 RepID=A0A517QYN5_9PLAN|nr:metallophosphoesterase [Stratiformator vulcanicus]QDT36755.1 hypothetical protein Pan189_11180 [Stratiformator vulcanicus]
MTRLILLATFVFSVATSAGAGPFEGFPKLDDAGSGEWWKVAQRRPEGDFRNLMVPRDEVIGFGLYTVSDGVLKLSAQLYPLLPEESREVTLEVNRDGAWENVGTEKVHELGWSALFRIEDWDDAQGVKYRLSHDGGSTYEGFIRKDPVHQDEIVVGLFSCNSNKDRGDRQSVIDNVKRIDPDLLFFAGDQSYDHTQHSAAWLMWGRQFADIIKDRPVIAIPDDHDIGQANIWGEGGKRAESSAGPAGGYYYPVNYVNMVQRCQTSHLPDGFDPTPIQRDISVYYTSLNVGGVDFAIIEDRKWKTGPKGKIPQQGPRPDHIINPDYDPASIDVPGLELLGKRQLDFLNKWGQDWTDTQMKCVLSQTIWSGAAHLHGRDSSRLHADLDNNGWPQAGRQRAVRELQRCLAVHLCGDQHLGTVTKYGIDEFRDGPWAFCGPAVVNSIYSRYWSPIPGSGSNSFDDVPLQWTGDYLDGFENKLTMRAYSNPDESPDYGSGYGIIRFKKSTRDIIFESWPRSASEGSKQFVGWPVKVNQMANDGREPIGYLPTLEFEGDEPPVVQVVAESTGEIIYTLRPNGSFFDPPVYGDDRYTIKIGPDRPDQVYLPGQRVMKKGESSIDVSFD